MTGKRWSGRQPQHIGVTMGGPDPAAPEPVEQFCRTEARSGIVLLLAAIAALAWANSPWASAYDSLWQIPVSLGTSRFTFTRSLQFWISDGLMVLFFLLVGLEIRRETYEGALANLKRASLPLVAAFGGIVVPALIYIGFNREPVTRIGWAIPTATDIAFATGVLALLGRRVPPALRAFLLAIAVADDVGAILLVAFVYSTRLDPVGLGLVAVASGILYLLLELPVRFVADRLALGAMAWIGLLHAGAHPALAGVILGLLMPMELVRPLERRLHSWVAFGVMPLYAFANAGIHVGGMAASWGASAALVIGIVVALVIGKPLGITLATSLALRSGLFELPEGIDVRRVFVAACIAGMGFTMSIFICHLAFVDQLLAAAKFAVLVASALAAVVGFTVGRALLDVGMLPDDRQSA